MKLLWIFFFLILIYRVGLCKKNTTYIKKLFKNSFLQNSEGIVINWLFAINFTQNIRPQPVYSFQAAREVSLCSLFLPLLKFINTPLIWSFNCAPWVIVTKITVRTVGRPDVRAGWVKILKVQPVKLENRWKTAKHRN